MLIVGCIVDITPTVLFCLGCHNKIPQTTCFNNRSLFSHSSGGWKSKMKVVADSFLRESSLPGLHMAIFLLYHYGFLHLSRIYKPHCSFFFTFAWLTFSVLICVPCSLMSLGFWLEYLCSLPQPSSVKEPDVPLLSFSFLFVLLTFLP